MTTQQPALTKEIVEEYASRAQQIIDAFPVPINTTVDQAQDDREFAAMFNELEGLGLVIDDSLILGCVVMNQVHMSILAYAGATAPRARTELANLIGAFAIAQKQLVNRLRLLVTE